MNESLIAELREMKLRFAVLYEMKVKNRIPLA